MQRLLRTTGLALFVWVGASGGAVPPADLAQPFRPYD